MRYSELTEGNASATASEIIRRDCQPWIQSLPRPTRTLAWRGINGLPKDGQFGRKQARLTNRRPASTGLNLHNSTNEMFIERFGKPFRNAVFVVGNVKVADEYGNPYAIFPIGEFEYVWNPEIDDLFGYTSETSTDQEALDLVTAAMPGYQATELSKGIRSSYEIMLWTTEYYYVSADIARTLLL